MTVYLVVEPGGYDESDTVLAVYATREAAEAHQRNGGQMGVYRGGEPVWYLDINEMPLLDAYESAIVPARC